MATSAAPVSRLPRRLSPSSIDRYRACGRRFLWQDVERRPVDFETTPELALGNAVHKTHEGFFKLDPSARSEAALHHILRSVWPSFRQRGTFTSLDHEIATGLEALEMLSRFVANFDITVQPLRLEQPLELRLTNGSRIHTRIDRIDRGSVENTIRLVDYKTGRRQVDALDLPHDSAAMVHLLAAEKNSGHQVERLSLIYVRSGEEVMWEPERDDVDAASDRLRGILQEMVTDTEFEPSPSPDCAWCPFAMRCDAMERLELDDFRPVDNLPF